MKRTKQQNQKFNQGITLVALVVTIVVLLILSSVSLNLVLGDNGIIVKAKEAAETTAAAQEKEAMERNLLKQIWNERRSNAFLWMELFVVFVILWYIVDVVYVPDVLKVSPVR